MPSRKSLWELVREAAEELEREGRVPFTRRDLAERIRRTRRDAKDSSLAPVIQGVTVNLKGGSPGGAGKDILRSVGRGLFELNRGSGKKSVGASKEGQQGPARPSTERPLDESSRFYLSFETDLQRFLERAPSAIEAGLQRVDREVTVEGGGRIDILCKDAEGSLVVVELKIGTADDAPLGKFNGMSAG
jgi:hypothetical protein